MKSMEWLSEIQQRLKQFQWQQKKHQQQQWQQNIGYKSSVEEESREALLLVDEGSHLAVHSSFQYSKHQRLVEREAKEVLKTANKTKAN